MNKHINVQLAIAALLISPAYSFASQDIYIYPSKGQSDEQLANDRFECHRWAVKETDFDPSQFGDTAFPRTIKVPVPANEAKGTTGKGTVAGAVVGGVIGSHDGEVGKGAVIGAVIGTVAGAAIEEKGQARAREKAELEATRQAEELAQTKAELALRRSNYRRALLACLEGRGYTVK